MVASISASGSLCTDWMSVPPLQKWVTCPRILTIVFKASSWLPQQFTSGMLLSPVGLKIKQKFHQKVQKMSTSSPATHSPFRLWAPQGQGTNLFISIFPAPTCKQQMLTRRWLQGKGNKMVNWIANSCEGNIWKVMNRIFRIYVTNLVPAITVENVTYIAHFNLPVVLKNVSWPSPFLSVPIMHLACPPFFLLKEHPKSTKS